ncbi:MAG: histidine triad (HIT) protein [Parcubacteria group bacterium Gr01-1014_33]|nr:MAG: histidine triad (HIT) protein [Parcubacteria group bacterium Gr01-1014_33]
MSDFLQVIKNLEALVKKTFGATMFNWACSMNHAYQVNPSNPQVHWHMIPRYIRPVEFRGKTFRDEQFGYRSVSEVDMVSDDILRAIVDALQNSIYFIKAIK